MTLIRCKAFESHPCMGKITASNLVCCHSCGEFENCKFRCESKPRSCGKGEVTIDDLYLPTKSQRAKADKCKKVMQFDENGNLIAEYDSISEAARTVEGGASFASKVVSISRCANEKQYTAIGYVWRYIE